MTSAEEIYDDIAANRVPGGSAFGQAGAELIAVSLEDRPDASDAQLRAEVHRLADWLTEVKPSMAVVRNLADRARAVADAAEPGRVTAAVVQDMRSYIRRSQEDIDRIAQVGAAVVQPGSRVLVHSFSKSMLAVLVQAAHRVGQFSLMLTESRPYRESRRLVEPLAAFDVQMTLFSDASVGAAAADADLAIVGADSIFRDGSFANKTGTLPLALVCREFQVPVHVATETAKLYTGDPDDIGMELRPADELAEGWEPVRDGRVHVRNQFFERTPADLVTSYLTERGPLSPSEMAALAARDPSATSPT